MTPSVAILAGSARRQATDSAMPLAKGIVVLKAGTIRLGFEQSKTELHALSPRSALAHRGRPTPAMNSDGT
ncbi:MAG: hypothetical protein MZU95_10230 [Desulfomicrobium escambiense]|nr:hypothetical protein [Desulfomicrobium escambiense]